MSKEREILQKILATNWLDYQLSCEVKELLAQPEPFKPDWADYRQGVADSTREPLSDKWLRDNIHLIHKDVSFIDLVRAIEKAHDRTGVDDE